MTIAEMKKMDAESLAEELKCGTYYTEKILNAEDADILENVVLLSPNCDYLIIHGTRSTWEFSENDIIPGYMADWIVYERHYHGNTIEVHVVEPC